MSKKQKFYVVWEGRQTGIFYDWVSCFSVVQNHTNAKFKAFESLEEAKKAFQESAKLHIYKGKNTEKPKETLVKTDYLLDSISVDASCKGNPGIMEYQGVITATKEIIFSAGPFEEATVNIGEFLAIVHALAWLKQQKSDKLIYSDSRTALSWLMKKKAKTNLAKNEKNAPVFDLLQRAESWLANNSYSNKVQKWQTEIWGENPADYGRK